MDVWAPAGFVPGVGRLGGLGLPSSSGSGVHKQIPDENLGGKPPEADECFEIMRK